jgi:hypothetical protein
MVACATAGGSKAPSEAASRAARKRRFTVFHVVIAIAFHGWRRRTL